ncbi:OsmC family protein [Saccharicrinis sp. FJH2]|uniref:OsmC family protein n=1 Tax=unclassified Saccharicrinis TaxID=2646859 RepID=UPI0035D4A4C6
MKNEINLSWDEGMAFSTDLDGHKLTLDASPEVGGQDKGARPKKLMLVSLAGCTGMDVVSILNKMRVQYDGLNIKVEGELTEEHPKYYKSMKVTYEFKGKDLPMDKLEKAVNLSAEKYCGVQALYRMAIPIESEIKVIE